MYRLIYYSDFKDVDDNAIRIEIYKESDIEIAPVELILSADAVSIDYNSDEIYKPLKQSACTVNVLTKDVLTNLYTGKLNDITLKILKNGNLFWFGYLTPNIYSSEFENDYDLLSLEFIDTVAQLENIKFSNTGNNIISFYAVLSSLLDRIDTNKVIKSIYLHSSLSINGNDDLLNKLYVQERNFFDEEEEAQDGKDVLKDIISYLGMSLIQFEDKFLILDYEALKQGNYTFISYDRISNKTDTVTLLADVRKVSEIGIAESKAQISLGNVYNKISIVANNNPIGDVLPKLFDDLTNQNSNANKYYTKTVGENSYFTAYFKSDTYKVSTCYSINNITAEIKNVDEITLNNIDSIYTGTYFQKNDSYKTSDGTPASIDWTDYLTMVKTFTTIGPDDTVVSLSVTKDNVIFKSGYLVLGLNYMLSQTHIAADTKTSSDAVFYNGKYSSGFKDTKFKCKLEIGNYYWDGMQWTTTESYFWLVRKNNVDERIFNTWYNLTNQVSYTDNLVNSDEGVLIKLPDFVLYGTLHFGLFAPSELGNAINYRTDKPSDYTVARYCHIKDFKLGYTNTKYYLDIFNQKEYEADVLYSNVVNEDYVTELDDITLKVNTYSETAGSYSYVLTKEDTEKYGFVTQLYNKGADLNMKMETSIIEKYVNYYREPKFSYTNILKNKSINPYTIVFEPTIMKDMVINSVTYNLSDNTAEITALEF